MERKPSFVEKYPQMASTIFEMPALEEPSFPQRVFDIRSYGAERDEETIETCSAGTCSANTQAFARAIQACHEQGGGTVLIPQGTWLSGPIHLRSNVRLHLEKDALVQFSTRFADYLPVVFTRWEGIECYNYSPLIYARDCENIAVTGEGAFDGQGQAWWHWKQLQSEAAKSLYDAQFKDIPVEERVYGTERAALRPQFLQTIHCRKVLVEGVAFHNGPMWTIHPVYCENVLVRNVTVQSTGPNTDGLNPDSCRNVLIEGCTFATGDDCIAINAGMNEDGWRVAKPCENIVIRNCNMREGHGAITIGSGMSGGVRNVYAHDCRVTGGDQGIRLKSMRGRGGIVENVHYENIHMAGLRQEAIVMDMFYASSTAESMSGAAPIFRHINVKNVTCNNARVAVSLRGLPEQPLEHVVLENLHLTAEHGILCQDVENLTLNNVFARAQQEPLFGCSNVRGLKANNFSIKKLKKED